MIILFYDLKVAKSTLFNKIGPQTADIFNLVSQIVVLKTKWQQAGIQVCLDTFLTVFFMIC